MDKFLDKLPPKLLGIVVTVALAFAGITTVFALLTGRSIDAWGFKIGAGSAFAEQESKSPNVLESHDGTQALEQERATLKAQLAASIVATDIPRIWTAGLSKNDVVQRLANHIQCNSEAAEDDESAECLFARLVSRIGRAGGAVDVMTCRADATVLLVQQCLRLAGAYQGPIDGNREAVRAALLKFQKENRIRSADGGAGQVGLKTLRKLRDKHSALVNEA